MTSSAGRWLLTTTVTVVAASAAAAGTLSLRVGGHLSCRQAEAVVTVEAAGRALQRRIRLEGGQAIVTFDIPDASHAATAARVEAKDCWAAPLQLPPGSTEGCLELWPAGAVTGSVKLEEIGGRPPRRLAVSLQHTGDADRDRQPPKALVICDATGGKLAGCSMPAGRWSLRVQADGWAPAYRWDVDLSPGRSVDLGKLVLRRGGSIAGEVTAEDGFPEGVPVVVTADPLMDRSDLRPADRERVRHLQLRTRAAPSGRFALSGVRPGRYRLRAEAPPYASATVVVEVEKGEETLLDSPLILRRPVRLEVDITPEAAPGNVAWTIELFSETESHELERRDGGTTRSGRWISSPLPPGAYWVQVLAPDGARLARRKVDLENDLQREPLDLDLVVVHGRVVLGEREIAARLWFGGRTGKASIETQSELDHGFEVMLPHPGRWNVDVLSEDPPVDRQNVEVLVDAGPDGTSEDAVVRLPDTTLQGEVVDENGILVSGAAVHLMRLDPFSQAALWTDETGWFEDHGLDPGGYELQAVLDDMRSDRIHVDLSEGASAPVRLVLRRSVTLHGRILSPSGLVPGAGVLAYPLALGGGMVSTTVPKAASDPEGRFELELPAQTATIRLVALAPGYAFSVRRVQLDHDQGEEVGISVRRGGGTLVIDPGDQGAAADFAVVYVGGEPIDLPLLRMWSRMNGGDGGTEGPLTVPAMPAGKYVVCRVTPREAFAVMGGLAAPKNSACTRGDLFEGSTLELTLP